MDVERMDEFNKELFVCLFAERRGREQKAAGMAAKRGGGGGGGGGVRCRPNGVVPQNRRGRRQTVRYVQIFHPQKNNKQSRSFWRLLLRVTIIFVLLAAFIVSAISEFFKFYCE
jgi:hypothetical protein